jgi:hypothetical protein
MVARFVELISLKIYGQYQRLIPAVCRAAWEIFPALKLVV